MKPITINLMILIWLMLLVSACGPAGAEAIHEGNDAFTQQDYAGALDAYKTAMKDAPDTAEPFYNAANTHYRQQDYDLAELRARQALQHATGELSEDAYFNLGNSLFQAQQYEAAIAAYEEVLWRNPQAEDAKQNLELAWQHLQQQDQQNQQQQDQQQDQESGEEEEQQQDQQSQEGDQEESGEEEQEASSSEESESEESAEEDESASSAGEEDSPAEPTAESSQPNQPAEGSEESTEEQPTTVQLTPAQAAQLLESAAREAETLQQYLQQQPTNNSAVEEDW